MADIKYLITVDEKGAVTSVKNWEGVLDDLGKKSKATGDAHGGMYRQIAFGISVYDAARKAGRLMFDFLKDSVAEAMESEEAEASLAAALQATGRARDGMLPGLLKYAEQIQKNTTYEDDETKSALALMAQLTNLDEKGLKQAMNGAVGLAAVMKMDLQGATRAVAQGYEGNFIALGRLIPEIRNAKTESEKHAAMEKALAEMYGQAEAKARTFAGGLKQLGNMWGEVEETAGGAITNNEKFRDVIVSVKDKISELLESGKIAEWADKATTFVLGLVDAFGSLKKGLPGLADYMAGEVSGSTKQVGDKIAAARKEALEWRDSLRVLKPSLEDVERESSKGAKSFQAYKDRMELLDNQLTSSRPKVVAWVEAAVDFFKTTEKIPPPVRTAAQELEELQKKLKFETKTGIKQEILDITKALRLFGADMPDSQVKKLADRLRELNAELVKNKKHTSEILPPVEHFLSDGKELTPILEGIDELLDSMGVMTKEWVDPLEQVNAQLDALLEKERQQKEKASEAKEETKSFWTEVSTIAADSARNIVGSLLDVFDIHKLLVSEAEEFDNSYYENLMAAADKAYDANRSRIQEQLDALKDATDKEIDLIKSKYEQMVDAAKDAYDAEKEAADRAHEDMVKKADRAYNRMMDAAKRAFDANELRISRAQEDQDRRRERAEAAEDRKYEREYERRRKDIENSTMSSKEKAAALLALEREYEKAKEARERAREDAAVARERAREDAKIARQKHYDDVKEKRERHYEDVKQIRERHYDDVQRIREVNQENKLEAIRAAGRAAEQEMRDAAAEKEREFLAQLFNLEQSHEDDKDNLRAAEEKARKDHADAEERRQKSLWTNIKRFFGTAVEEMLTVWLTGPNSWLGGILSGTGKAKKAIEDVGGKNGLGGLADTAKAMSGGFLSALGSVGSIISGIVGLLELLKGPQKQTDVTYWLKLQWELQREMHDWMFINCQEKLNFYALAFSNIGEWMNDQHDTLKDVGYNVLPGKLSLMESYLREIQKNTGSSADSLKRLAPIKAASGFEGMVTSPRLFLAGESGPERVSISPVGSPAYAPGGAGGGLASPRVLRVEMPVFLDGRQIYVGVKELLIEDSHRIGGLPLDTKSFVSQ